MKKTTIAAALACILGAGVVMNGCGGQTTSPASHSTISGKVSPSGATSVLVTDSSTPARETTASVSADGAYSVEVSGLVAPFSLVTSGDSANGSFAARVTAPGTANINAITTAATSSSEGSDDHHEYGDSLMSLRTALAPLLDCYRGGDDGEDHEDAGDVDFRALLQDVSFSFTDGVLTITNRATGGRPR